MVSYTSTASRVATAMSTRYGRAMAAPAAGVHNTGQQRTAIAGRLVAGKTVLGLWEQQNKEENHRASKPPKLLVRFVLQISSGGTVPVKFAAEEAVNHMGLAASLSLAFPKRLGGQQPCQRSPFVIPGSIQPCSPYLLERTALTHLAPKTCGGKRWERFHPQRAELF